MTVAGLTRSFGNSKAVLDSMPKYKFEQDPLYILLKRHFLEISKNSDCRILFYSDQSHIFPVYGTMSSG